MNSSIICHSDKNIFLVLFKLCQRDRSRFYTSENTRDFYEAIYFTSHSCSVASFKLMFSEVHKPMATANHGSQQSGSTEFFTCLRWSDLVNWKSRPPIQSKDGTAESSQQRSWFHPQCWGGWTWKPADEKLQFTILTRTGHWCRLAFRGPL